MFRCFRHFMGILDANFRRESARRRGLLVVCLLLSMALASAAHADPDPRPRRDPS
jgi:hypothetical protein